MRTISFATGLRGTLVVGLLGLTLQAFTRSSQPPTGRTGAPGQNTCTSCHNGTVNSGGGSVALTGLPANGYVPGTTYPLTVTVSDGTASRFGFEMAVLASRNNISQGTLAVTAPTRTSLQTSGNITYIGHRNANSQNTWTFNWTAPATGSGSVIAYLVGLAANNNGSSSGDKTYSTQVPITENITTGIADDAARAAGQLTVFPNPANEVLRLQGAALTGARLLTLTDALGREVLRQAEGAAELDIRTLPVGLYTLHLLTAQGQSLTRPIVIRH